MPQGQPFKKCPQCGTPSPLQTPACPACGRAFHTQFAQPMNQTQAFTPGVEGMGVPMQPAPVQQGSFDFAGFLLGLSPLACGAIGFFFSISAIVLVFFYFMHPPRGGTLAIATTVGIVLSLAVGVLFAMLIMSPSFLMRGGN